MGSPLRTTFLPTAFTLNLNLLAKLSRVISFIPALNVAIPVATTGPVWSIFPSLRVSRVPFTVVVPNVVVPPFVVVVSRLAVVPDTIKSPPAVTSLFPLALKAISKSSLSVMMISFLLH